MDTSTPQHPFERSGLGRAPFRFVGCYESRGPLNLGDGRTVGAPGQPMGTCAHCGMGIAVCCTIQDADGKRFVVGSVCVNKTADAGLIKQTRTAMNTRLAAARQDKAVKRKAWIEANLEAARATLQSQPHPGGYDGKTAYDWAVWMTKNAGDAGRKKVEAALRAVMGDK
jgi:hypothetical protein